MSKKLTLISEITNSQANYQPLRKYQNYVW